MTPDAGAGRVPASPSWRAVLRHEDRWVIWLHWLALGAAFVFLLVITRHHWFDTDEWDALVDRKLFGGGATSGLWQPHNEHWSTVPILLYRILFSIFALRTYLPYMVMVVLAHLLVVQLLWLLLRRLGVQRWVALVAVTGFAFLAAGADDFLFPWQASFDLSVAAGLGALLLVPERGPWQRRDLWVWALLLVGLASSGIGLTMLAVVLLVQLLRRGWRVALRTLSLPAAVYVVWYAAYGKQVTRNGPEPFTKAIQQVPGFVWHGLTDPVSATVEFGGVGTVVIVLLAVWAVRRAEVTAGPWPVAVAMAVAAPLFLAGTAIRRVQYGETAGAAPRYAYVVLLLLIPLAALAVSALLDRAPWRALIIVGGLGLLLLVGASTVKRASDDAASRQRDQKGRILASAVLARTTSHFLAPLPVPFLIPNLTVAKIHRLDANGDLPSTEVPASDRLTALEYVQVSVGADRGLTRGGTAATIVGGSGATFRAAAQPGCVDVVAASDRPSVRFQLHAPVSVAFRADRNADWFLELDQGNDRGRPHDLPIRGQARTYLNIDAPGTVAVVTIPPLGTTQFCGTSIVPGLATSASP